MKLASLLLQIKGNIFQILFKEMSLNLVLYKKKKKKSQNTVLAKCLRSAEYHQRILKCNKTTQAYKHEAFIFFFLN